MTVEVLLGPDAVAERDYTALFEKAAACALDHLGQSK